MSYYWLVNSTKLRLIQELRESFSRNPYFSKIVPFIQDKFSFRERPQFGIVLKSATGDKKALSAQNFVGNVSSYVMQATVGNHPGIFVEWVREDTQAITKNKHVFPSPPSIYILEVLAVSEMIDQVTIVCDTIQSIFEEPLITFVFGDETTAELAQDPMSGSLRLFSDTNYMLDPVTDYTVSGRVVTFLTPFIKGSQIFADYKVLRITSSPIEAHAYSYNNTLIPGVVIAFGNRLLPHDKIAIVVTDSRVPSHEEYGGHYELSFDLDVISRDTDQGEKIADFAAIELLKKKDKLCGEGLSITEGPTLSGQSEEVYDEEGELHYFMSSFNLSILTDWSYYKALPLTIYQVLPITTIMSQTKLVTTFSEKDPYMPDLETEKLF